MPVGFKGSTQSWTAEDSVGFKHVDVHVTNVMITWIGRVLEETCRELLVLNKETSNVIFCKTTVHVEIQMVSIWYYGVWRDSTNLGMFGIFELSSTCLTFLAVGSMWAESRPSTAVVGACWNNHCRFSCFPHLFQHGFVEKYMSFGTPKFGATHSSSRGQIWPYTLSSPLICSIFWWSDCVRVCQRMSGQTNKHTTERKKVIS